MVQLRGSSFRHVEDPVLCGEQPLLVQIEKWCWMLQELQKAGFPVKRLERGDLGDLDLISRSLSC